MYNTNTLTLSIVVPVYSGEAYVELLAEEIQKFKIGLEAEYHHIRLGEAIFVSDDAIDASPVILNRLAETYDWLTALHLSRNYGQHPATIAGILHTSGDWVITLDEDLQHPPSKILLLLDKVRETQADIVYAKPLSGVHNSFFRDFSSKSYKFLMRKLTGVTHIPKFNSFRLIRGPIARASGSICGPDTYLDIATTWFTNRIEVVEIPLKDERYISSGKSSYSLGSLLSHARRMAFSSRINALRFGAAFGILISVISIFAISTLTIAKVLNPDLIPTRGWTSLVLLISLFGGITLSLIGLSLEYLALLVQKAHGKPIFFVTDRSRDKLLSELDNTKTKSLSE